MENNGKQVLEFKDVRLTYHTKAGETTAAEHMSFCVDEGEFIAVIGPSGCGKTTVLSLAAGLLRPSAGEVRVAGGAAHPGNIGYMLQKDELFPWRTVEKNLFLPLEIGKRDTPENRRRAVALAEKYGLGGFLKHYPAQLSGGMRQRAALIRTLASDPRLLLLDEPFSALDPSTKERMYDTVRDIHERFDCTIVFVTHDFNEAAMLADRVGIVLEGRLRAILPAQELFEAECEPDVAAFLGRE